MAEFPVEDQDKPKPIAPIPHESFLAKKAKYEGKKPATETFLDLKLLKRNNLGKDYYVDGRNSRFWQFQLGEDFKL